MYAQNSYSNENSLFGIVFLKQTLPYTSSVNSVSLNLLEDWITGLCRDFNRLPRIGIYFPFEGEELYSTILNLGWCSYGLRNRIPQYLKMTKLRAVISDVAIPTFVLLNVQNESIKPKDVGIDTFVPYAALGNPNNQTLRVLTRVKQPLVEGSQGLRGVLTFEKDVAGGHYKRLGFSEKISESENNSDSLQKMLKDINEIGIRVWPILPAAYVLNTSDPEWKKFADTSVDVARRVATWQTTSVLLVGDVGTLAVPSDFIQVGYTNNVETQWTYR